MITLYGHGTPNAQKISIALEELGLPYETELVDFMGGATHTPEYLKIHPAGKIPAIRDGDTTVCESNAILLYLADKTGRLAPPVSDNPARIRLLERLFIQGSLQGPMFGQRGFFAYFAPETVPLGIERYEEQGRAVDTAVERMLADGPYLMGADYSIVDISFYGWYFAASRMGYLDKAPKPVRDWFDRVHNRDAVARGIAAFPLFDLPPRKQVA